MCQLAISKRTWEFIYIFIKNQLNNLNLCFVLFVTFFLLLHTTTPCVHYIYLYGKEYITNSFLINKKIYHQAKPCSVLCLFSVDKVKVFTYELTKNLVRVSDLFTWNFEKSMKDSKVVQSTQMKNVRQTGLYMLEVTIFW